MCQALVNPNLFTFCLRPKSVLFPWSSLPQSNRAWRKRRQRTILTPTCGRFAIRRIADAMDWAVMPFVQIELFPTLVLIDPDPLVRRRTSHECVRRRRMQVYG